MHSRQNLGQAKSASYEYGQIWSLEIGGYIVSSGNVLAYIIDLLREPSASSVENASLKLEKLQIRTHAITV